MRRGQVMGGKGFLLRKWAVIENRQSSRTDRRRRCGFFSSRNRSGSSGRIGDGLAKLSLHFAAVVNPRADPPTSPGSVPRSRIPVCLAADKRVLLQIESAFSIVERAWLRRNSSVASQGTNRSQPSSENWRLWRRLRKPLSRRERRRRVTFNGTPAFPTLVLIA
jgi:hypothetical protein